VIFCEGSEDFIKSENVVARFILAGRRFHFLRKSGDQSHTNLQPLISSFLVTASTRERATGAVSLPWQKNDPPPKPGAGQG
jgi:hypothetical protein